jgi:nucleotide-binding universal stress UspA family protein
MLAPIVVGTDGSQPAAAAVVWAADEAVRRSLPLRIVHVREPWSYGTPFYPAPGVLDELSKAGEQVVVAAAELARRNRPDLQVETKLVFGRVAECLREQAADAFEVVVGHRGLGGFAGLLLGAVGLRVAGQAVGPVVVVRGDAPGDHGEIVVGIDLAVDSAAVLEYAFEVASVRGARLRAVYAWTVPDIGFAADIEKLPQSASAGLSEVIEPWPKRYPDVEVVTEAIQSHAVRALADASVKADLVIVGSPSHDGFGRMLLGSVGHGIVHHAHCPVAVVRPRG